MVTLSNAPSTTTVRNPGALVRSIIVTWLVIGVIGGIDYTAFFYLTLHQAPMAVFQYIASGLLGLSAFAGSYTTAALGFVIHMVIALVVAAVFILVASQIAFLRTGWVFLAGLVYGAVVNMFMSMVVLPLSAAPKMPVTTVLIVHGLIADALVVGLPVAIAVWQNTRASRASAAA